MPTSPTCWTSHSKGQHSQKQETTVLQPQAQQLMQRSRSFVCSLWQDILLAPVSLWTVSSPNGKHPDLNFTEPLSFCMGNTSTVLNQKSLHPPSARQILINTPELSSAFSIQYRKSMDISYRSFFLETQFLTFLIKKSKDNLKYYNKGFIQKFCSFSTVNIK